MGALVGLRMWVTRDPPRGRKYNRTNVGLSARHPPLPQQGWCCAPIKEVADQTLSSFFFQGGRELE